jgi:serine phosphatase RsbU (regulator of sigma subunit)/Tfp pilus assembly protein PilF
MIFKRLLFTFAALFIFLTLSLAQQSERDSLVSSLKTANDAEKAEIYLTLAEIYSREDSSFIFVDQVFKIADLKNDAKLKARAYNQMGKLYGFRRDNNQALENIKQARAIVEKLDEPQLLASIFNNLCQSYYNLNSLEEAILSGEKALEISKSHDDLENQGNALHNLANVYLRKNDYEKTLDYLQQSLKIREELGGKEELASILNDLGRYYYLQTDFANAIKYYTRTLDIRRAREDERGVAIALNNLGNAHLQLGNFDKAIASYKEASEIFKKINYDLGTAATLTGMAVIYENLQQYESALQVYKEVLLIRKKLSDDRELANTYSNMAIIYSFMLSDTLESIYGKNYEDSIYNEGIRVKNESAQKAIEYGLIALNMRRELKDFNGISTSLANLGTVSSYMGDFKKARQYFKEYLDLPIEFQDDDSRIAINMGLGRIYMYEGDLSTADIYLNESYRIAKLINKKTYLQFSTEQLAILYEKKGNYKLAYEYYQSFTTMKDSLIQADTRNQIYDLQVQYETITKEKENELLRKDQMIAESKLKQSRRAIITFIIVFIIFVGLIIQLIRQNSLRKKANEELAKKNALITEQKKEITDSIQYASRIQNAVLPPEEFVSTFLPQQFILFKPRDIVSGDFYWMAEKQDRIITIVADCTGHGVPGAFMSMLGVAFLNEIISKNDSITADQILNELRAHVINSLHQTGREGESQDGMDVSLFIIDKKSSKLEFSGANNNLIIIRNSDLIELKGDKMPIGIHTRVNEGFTAKQFDLQKGDMLYAFSDGYADQFGGPQSKKFMIKSFKRLLLNVHQKELKEQKNILESTINRWMANTNQIDDIIVMGIRV